MLLEDRILNFVQNQADKYKRTVEAYQAEYEKAVRIGNADESARASERVLRALVAYNTLLEVREGILKIKQGYPRD